MNIRTCLVIFGLVAVAAWVIGQEILPEPDPLPDAPPTDVRHYSYAIGRQIGGSFHQDQTELDADSLLAGVKDALSGAEPRYTAELCQVALQRLSLQRLANAKKRNEEYLAKNRKAEGVVTLPSGLQYKVLKRGTGPSPKATDMVRVNYRGAFIDGTIFDASGEGPAPFRVDGVIDGWTEALQLMKVGDRWQLVIPSDLAYGPQGDGPIPPHATLVFEVELVGIER
jgi:FKBP-type peptidyl-prolyl cis-trans isomerase